MKLNSCQVRLRIVRDSEILPGGEVGTQFMPPDCYHRLMFNFGKPKTAADWLVHVAGAIVALFLVRGLLRLYVL